MLLFLLFYFMIFEYKEAISLSDRKLVSPLLDGFAMGSPMSSHDGICCCPAMKENTDEKYIVKIISIPHTTNLVNLRVNAVALLVRKLAVPCAVGADIVDLVVAVVSVITVHNNVEPNQRTKRTNRRVL